MSLSDEQLDRVEKATSLVRNVVLIVGAIASLLTIIYQTIDEPIIAQVSGTPVRGSEIFILPSDSIREIVDTTKSSSLSSVRSTLNRVTGRLDFIGDLLVKNTSDDPIDLEVRFKHMAVFDSYNEPGREPHFSKVSYLLLDVFSNCTAIEQEAERFSGMLVLPDSSMLIHFNRFPPGCSMRINIAHAKAIDLVVEVYYNGKRAKLVRGSVLYGFPATFVEWLDEYSPLSYLVAIIAPLIALILVTSWLTKAIITKTRVKEIAPESATPTASNPTSDS